jgi:ATP-dependent Clp protease ATP-binding subunit ClpA
MFSGMKSKIHDMSTIRKLCEAAETHALQDRQRHPGAEHFLLAALDLEDGTARRAFQVINADPEGLKPAIERQYSTALLSVGIAVAPAESGDDAAPRRSEPGAYQAAPSGQELMLRLAGSRRHAQLLGAHIVAIVASMPHGVAARALRGMGIDATALQAAAEEIANNGSPA